MLVASLRFLWVGWGGGGEEDTRIKHVRNSRDRQTSRQIEDKEKRPKRGKIFYKLRLKTQVEDVKQPGNR